MNEIFYLAGVLHGDGFNGKKIGLLAKDKDFVEEFARCLNIICNQAKKPIPRGDYWEVRIGNKTGKFNFIKDTIPISIEQKGAWIRGFFDSDGTATFSKLKKYPNSYCRSIRICKSKMDVLEKCAQYLRDINIPCKIVSKAHGTGHFGTKPMFEVKISICKENCERFKNLVGSSIARKFKNLCLMCEYQNPDEYLRRGQLIGAAAKKKKTIEIMLPSVVKGIKSLLDNGIKPTQRNCRSIIGYNTIQTRYSQSDLIQMAQSI